MQSSYRIFKIFGISVELHFTFVLFLGVIFLRALWDFLTLPAKADLAMQQGIQDFFLLIILFSIVLIHELFHSLTAKHYGIPVPRITLTPIGGLANIELPEDPKKEFLISLAGPMSNFLLLFVIAVAAVAIDMPLSGFFSLAGPQGELNIFNAQNLLNELFWINLMLGVFNLLPGFPMDGGRVLRALLAFWMGYVKATEIAVKVGRLISILLIVLGLFENPVLLLIGIFLLLSGGQELSVLKLRHSFAGLKLRNIAVQNVRYVSEEATIRDFMGAVASPEQDHYPVVDPTGKVVGVLRISDLRNVSGKDMDGLTVRHVAVKQPDVLDANLDVEESLGTLLSKDFVLIVDAGKVIGYVTPGHLIEASKFYGIARKV